MVHVETMLALAAEGALVAGGKALENGLYIVILL